MSVELCRNQTRMQNGSKLTFRKGLDPPAGLYPHHRERKKRSVNV